MKTVYGSIILILLAGMFSCVTSDINVTKDKFSNSEIAQTDSFNIYKEPQPPKKKAGETALEDTTGMELKFKKITTTDGKETFNVVLYFSTENPVYSRAYNFGGQDSLQFKVDDQIYKLSTDNRSAATKGESPGIVARRHYEWVEYENVDMKILDAIANSKVTTVRAKSDRDQFDGYTRGLALETLKKLMGPTGAESPK